MTIQILMKSKKVYTQTWMSPRRAFCTSAVYFKPVKGYEAVIEYIWRLFVQFAVFYDADCN